MATSEEQNMGNLVPLQEVERMAAAVAKSGLFGIKSPEQAIALMLVAQADGIHPAAAARDYDIIQGRPAKKAEAMLRQFIQAGGSVEWHQLDDTCADATFSHPQGGSVRIAWDMRRAEKAGLASKEMYKKWPRQMLRSRCVSEGVRTVCPSATGGLYTPEEAIDMGPTEPKDMGAAEVVDSGMQPRAVEPEKAAPENVTDAEVVDKGSPEKAQPAQASNGTGAPVSENHMRVIRAQLGRSGKTEEALCKHFGIGKLDELTVDKLNEAVAWAKSKD